MGHKEEAFYDWLRSTLHYCGNEFELFRQWRPPGTRYRVDFCIKNWDTDQLLLIEHDGWEHHYWWRSRCDRIRGYHIYWNLLIRKIDFMMLSTMTQNLTSGFEWLGMTERDDEDSPRH